MSERPRSADIGRTAADWVALADRRELTPEESARLSDWRAADSRHEGAYVRAQAAWLALDRARALAGPNDALPEASRPLITRRRLLAAGSALAASAAGFLVWDAFQRHRYETAVGEILQVPLRDGSTAAINTATRMNVAIGDRSRHVTLEEGEAWFDVAPDPERPFVVEAGAIRVRAVGTAFSVRRRGVDAEVIVTEGTVETWSVEAPERAPLRLEAGSRAIVAARSEAEPATLSPNEIDRRLAWREGMIVLDGQTLAEAAAEFNRYNAQQIVVSPELADERLVGFFRAYDTAGFAAAVETTLRARAQTRDGQLHLSRAPGRASRQ